MSAATRIGHVTDTAHWVAVYRAEEDRRPDALFRDPFAKLLTDGRGERIARAMARAGSGRYSRWTLAVRTRLLDELIGKYLGEGVGTVINLGAGLDTRPYRLDLPASTHWIEVDFPGLIAWKASRLAAERPRCRLERIGVDLTQPEERRKALRELDARIGSALVLTEGVIPYLDEFVVAELATDLRACAHIGLWIAEYYSPRIYSRFQSRSHRRSLGEAPFRFFPPDGIAFFAERGWGMRELEYLYDVGEKVGRPFPLPWWARLVLRFADREDLARKLRLTAYMVLAKAAGPTTKEKGE